MDTEPGSETIRPSEVLVPASRLDTGAALLDAQEDNADCDVAELTKRFQIALSILDRIVLGPRGETVPHLVRLLVSTVLATAEDSPVCIILPTVEGIASLIAMLAALEGLAFDLPQTRAEFLANLRPGQRVRLYPTGEVFILGDRTMEPDGFRLHLTDKKSLRSNASRLIPRDRALWFEPTLRHQPLGLASTRFVQPPISDLDVIVGSPVFGNSGLARTRILLAGTRAEFDRSLHGLTIQPQCASPNAGQFADVFPFGAIDGNGSPFVIHPSGGAGQPLVAIARDLPELEGACLGPSVAAGSRIVVTDRVELVLKNLDIAGRIAERQRLIVFAEARKRADLGPLISQRWTLWEPSPKDILGRAESLTLTGCRGIDRSRRAADGENRSRPGFVSCTAPELQRAEEALTRLGTALTDESVAQQFWAEELLDAAQGLFFASSGWLQRPGVVEADAARHATARLRSGAGQLERLLGNVAAAAAVDLADAAEQFRTSIEEAGITPKGAEILKRARAASGSSFRQVFVAGNRLSRQEADAFFQGSGLDVRCLAVSELLEATEQQSVVAFSVMRREIFEKLIDPWPAGNLLFVGYDFEIECYRRRLARRETLRAKARVRDDQRTRITGLPETEFTETLADTGSLAPPPMDHRLADFDRATREWNWSRRITVPRARQGEEICSARIVRFVGRSWSAMTDDHRSLALSRDNAESGTTSVRLVQVEELAAGMRIVVREGTERDIIRQLAEQRVGEDRYGRLRERCSLWTRAIRSASTNVRDVSARLEEVGLRRNPVTIRAWLTNDELIGPRSEKDLIAIAEAFPIRGGSQTEWRACWNAISEVRSLHIWAGSRLTELLVTRCGEMLFEPSDVELAVDLGIGVVWVLEVNSIESEARECPVTYVNRLHWLNPAWRERLLAHPVRESAA